MVNTTVDNEPISEQLSNGGSISVPSGETWKVTIVHTDDGSGDSNVTINGTEVTSADASASSASASNEKLNAILESGDTIGFTGDRSCHIGGYVVSS